MIYLQSILFILFTIKPQGGQSADISSLECDFTSNLCEWRDPTSLVWGIGDYGEASFGQPVKEVVNGGFISVHAPLPNEYLLESPTLDQNIGPFCLYFNYYMFGPETGSLTLQAVNTETEEGKTIKIQENVWKREGSQYDDWILGKYHVSPSKGNGQFILQFIATSQDIALGPIKYASGSCNYNNDCDFEDPSLCFWTVEPDYRSNYRWFVSNGSESAKDLVNIDVTTETNGGHFMRTPKNAMIKSSSSLNPTIYLTPYEAKCLSFYFYKPSENSDILEIDLETTSISNHLIWFSNRVSVVAQWIPIEINLGVNNDDDYLKLSLKVSREDKGASPIAIDEIKISPEACISTGSCNFNEGLCNYRLSSSQLLVGFGRLADPSVIKWVPIKNIDPYDLFVYTNTPKTDELIGYTLESPIINPDSKTCLTFSYALSFKEQASFSISLTPSDTKTPVNIWTLNNPESHEQWNTIKLSTPLDDYTKTPFKLSFNFDGIQMFMGIDDILLQPCTDEHGDKPKKSCNYDGLIDNQCIEIVPSSYNNWQFMDTNKLRQKVPPIFNDNDDQVLAFDLSIPSQSESMSFFYFSNFKAYTPYCLKFWYIIDGNLKLNLWKSSEIYDFNEYLLIKPWVTFNNHYGLNWDQAKIQVDEVNPESIIIFGADYISNSLGTVIIDGLEMMEGECSLDYEYFCDFEEDCLWNNFVGGKLTVTGMGKVYEAKTKWIETSAKGRLPSRDSSLKTIAGHYLILESIKGEEAIFTFPPIYLADNSSELCLLINIYPVGTNNLDIIIEQSGIITLVESLSTPKGYFWLPFEALLKFNPKLSKVVHVYLVGSGSFAIDDLSIKMGSCSPQKFTCNDGKTILSFEVCDHKVDCSEGEDEENCGNCDFNVDFCGYKHDTIASWSIKNDQAVVEATYGFWGSKISGLTSPTLRPTSPTCKIQFHYKDRTPEANQLKILLLFQDGRYVEIWDDNMISTLESEIVQIDVGRVPIPFNIQFYAKLSISFFDKKPIYFGAIKLIDCDYGDTVDQQSETSIYKCLNDKRIRQEQVCDSSLDCFDGDDEVNCDRVKIYSFEDQEAPLYWIDISDDKVKWASQRAEGSVSSTPPRDHSRGLSGAGYMAVYPFKDFITSAKVEKEISLVGPELANIDGCSMVFYYNTAGVTLTVAILNDTTTKDLMTIPTSSTFGFKRQRITLKRGDIQGRFNFVFKARYSQNDMSNFLKSYYAVVDDVVIDSECFLESDEPIDPTSKCNRDEYHCTKDDTCISMDYVCDYRNDCSNGSDEINCGQCQFDGSTCGWINEGEDYWVLPEDYELDIDKIAVPILDKPENFIIPARRTSIVQSILKSPRLGPTSPVCKFRFKYFVRPYATMTIRVRNEQETSIIFDVLESANSWAEQEYKLESLTPGYHIQFVLEVSSKDLFEKLSPGGLANFEFTDCNPHWNPSWLTSTQPSIATETTKVPATLPTTTKITTTTQTVTTTTIPTTHSVTTVKPDITPHREINPTQAPITIAPSPSVYENPKSDGIHFGSAPFILLGIASIILVTIVATFLVKKHIFGTSYSPNGVIPLLETNYRLEEAIGQEGSISFRDLQQIDSENSNN